MKRATNKKTTDRKDFLKRVTSNSFKNIKLNEMKTINNVQKAISKSLVVGLSLVLISITLNAQDFWKSLPKNNSFNEFAFAIVENKLEANPVSADASISIDANAMAAYLEEETEESLELEEWMINENYFATFIFVEDEIENPLELEDWMTNETRFDANSMYFEVETEETLELENWMTSENYFGNSAFQIIEETDNELELEDWMLKDDLFNTTEESEHPLDLEGWMTSEEIWKN